MTHEEKELLIQDLCSRLPYGVKIELINNSGYHHENIAKKGDKTIDTLKGFTGKYFTINHDNPLDWDWADSEIEIEDIKPYLFPLSNMTEEQRKELQELHFDYISDEIFNDTEFVYHYDCMYLIDWLNKNHFDWRGLIPIGLAKDATGLGIY